MPTDDRLKHGATGGKSTHHALVEQPGFPLLKSSHSGGYLHIAHEERHFTAIALEHHADLVEIWYRLFTLYDAAAASTHTDSEGIEGTIDQQLRMQLMAVAAGTGKQILDLTLAGHYAQARSLIRHLFESLICIWYVRTTPDEAGRWFVTETGDPPRPPKLATMYTPLSKSLKGEQRKLLDMVMNTIKVMDSGAHPSPQTALQTVTTEATSVKMGGNYIEKLCLDTLHHGASGLRLLVGEWTRLLKQSATWGEEFQKVVEDHRIVMGGYRERGQAD